jgi:hypothetical protein
MREAIILAILQYIGYLEFEGQVARFNLEEAIRIASRHGKIEAIKYIRDVSRRRAETANIFLNIEGSGLAAFLLERLPELKEERMRLKDCKDIVEVLMRLPD